MSRVEWMSFAQLRGDAKPRDWLRWSELWAIVQAEIHAMRWFEVRDAVRGMAADRRYGHEHYTPEHLEAVRAYAAARGLTKKGVE